MTKNNEWKSMLGGNLFIKMDWMIGVTYQNRAKPNVNWLNNGQIDIDQNYPIAHKVMQQKGNTVFKETHYKVFYIIELYLQSQ